MTLLCSKCGKEKPAELFKQLKSKSAGINAKPSKRGHRDSWCNPCHVEAQRGYVARKDPARHREAKRATHYRTTYGITLGEYEKLNNFRDKGCWVCSKPGKTRGLSLDHDHKTGQVRGLLCQSCNRGLRWFSDDPTRLRSAATYLETCDQLMVTALAYSDSPTGGQ